MSVETVFATEQSPGSQEWHSWLEHYNPAGNTWLLTTRAKERAWQICRERCGMIPDRDTFDEKKNK